MIPSYLKIVDNEFVCTNPIIEQIQARDLKVYYSNDNLFKYIPDNTQIYRKAFYENYLPLIESGNAHGYKYLIDSFLYVLPYSPFCLVEIKDGFRLTKGHKKLQAYAVNDMNNANMLFVSKTPIGEEIKTDRALFEILKKLDPKENNFLVELDIDGNIHVAESITTATKWAKPSKLLTIPELPLKVKFTGLATTIDNRLLPSEDFYCHVHSDVAVNISLEYLLVCSNNTYYNKLTKIGTTDSLKITYAQGEGNFIIPKPL